MSTTSDLLDRSHRAYNPVMRRIILIAAGAIVSGLAFGLVHFEPHTLPILAFVGIVLALVFEYSRSVYASFLVHGTVNFLAVLSVFH